MKQSLCRIYSNHRVAEGYNLLEFGWPADAEAPVPGQFVTIRSENTTDPLLRRPFAVSAISSGLCQIVYQIRGKATHSLAATRKDDLIDVLGPLGNGFPAPQPERRPYLLGGGIGFGPIYYLANTLAGQGIKPVAIIGARTAALIPDLPYPRLDDNDDLFHFCTDDGSGGFQGTVIEMMQDLLEDETDTIELFACGPNAMLGACAVYAEKADIPCWVSMEQVMACGVGACMGCAIRTKRDGEYLRVCTDGPVFSGKDLQW